MRSSRSDLDQLLNSDAPFWRRPRQLRRQLAAVQTGAVLVAMLLVGGLNFGAAGWLLKAGSDEQLILVAESRASSIELGLNALLADVSATAADLAVVDALDRFSAAYSGLESVELDESANEALEDWYDDVLVSPLRDSGIISLSLDDVLPTSAAGQYLQYHHLVAPSLEGVEGIDVLDVGDGSVYSEVHRDTHPFLSSLLGPTVGDVLLVSARSGDIVYTSNKSLDFGTSLAVGPLRDSALAHAVLDLIPSVRPGEAVLADLEIYLPSGGAPTLFVAAAVQSETEVIGALVFRIPVDAIDAITTAGGRWAEVGLGEGESYIVGADSILRSVSRSWLDDPDAYLDQVDNEELAGYIALFGSPVGLQPVDTQTVSETLISGRFEGKAHNYLGEPTRAFATEIEVGGLRWVIVAERPRSDVNGPLRGYALRLAILIAALLPAAALGGLVLADRLTNSIPELVVMAERIADGTRGLEPAVQGRNEFGELARRLGEMSIQLDEQEANLERESERHHELLLAVSPPRLARVETGVKQSHHEVGQSTVVAVSVEVDPKHAHDHDVDDVLSRFSASLDSLASGGGVERVRSGTEHSLFIADVDSNDSASPTAVAFARRVIMEALAWSEADESPILVRVGLASGEVSTAMLSHGLLAFNAWGTPVGVANSLVAMASPMGILIEDSVQRVLPEEGWIISQKQEVRGLDGSSYLVRAMVAADSPVGLVGTVPSQDRREKPSVGGE